MRKGGLKTYGKAAQRTKGKGGRRTGGCEWEGSVDKEEDTKGGKGVGMGSLTLPQPFSAAFRASHLPWVIGSMGPSNPSPFGYRNPWPVYEYNGIRSVLDSRITQRRSLSFRWFSNANGSLFT